MASLGNPAYEPYVGGAVQAAGQLGYTTFVCDAEYNDDLYRLHLRRLLEHQVDGLIISERIHAPDLLEPFLSRGLPIEPDPRESVTEFGFSRQVATRQVLDEAYGELVELGHRNVAYLKVARPGAPRRIGSEERIRALIETYASVDGGLAEVWDVPGGQSAVEDFVFRALSKPNRPTAVVVSSMALEGFLRAVERLPLQIPRDLSALCVGEVPWARFCSPPLSTIGADSYELGARAARRIVAVITGDDASSNANPAPPFRYVRRGSVGPARISSRKSRKAEQPMAALPGE